MAFVLSGKNQSSAELIWSDTLIAAGKVHSMANGANGNLRGVDLKSDFAFAFPSLRAFFPSVWMYVYATAMLYRDSHGDGD